MKKIPLLAILSFAVCGVHAAPLLTEEYPSTYGEGTRLGQDQATGGYNTKWPNGNSIGTGSPTNTVAGALTYAPLQPISGTASYGMRISSATSRNTIAPITPNPSGDGNSVYWSFLINVPATTPTARIIGGFRSSTGTGNQSLSIGISATRQLQLYKNSAVVATHGTTLTAGTTYFVVGRYKFVLGTGQDEVALWLNPATGNSSETTPDNVSTNGSDQTLVASLQLLSAADASGPLYLDEHRVTTNWAEATPSAAACISPAITNQPSAQVVCQGDTAVFIVGVTNSGLVYQWSKNGTALTNGPTANGSTNSGVTTATLTITKVALGDAALAAAGYDCLITNSCGLTNSDRVALTVNAGPSTAFNVTGGGGYCSGGGGVAVGLSGSESGVTYYLRNNGVNNGISTNGTGSLLDFGSQTAAGTYTVSATNGTGCSALMTTNAVVVINSQPGITTEPVGATVAVGGSATFSVVATGGSLTYQWRTNSVNIGNATNATYTLYPTALSDAALAANGYDCTITGPCGSTNSARVALVVNVTSDLIWAGDGGANLWNTLGAANWSNGVALAQFTSGDRVTFDDSSVNGTTFLTGTQIPSAVTVNAAANYTFSGSGNLGGSLATLTKAGTGTLTLGTAHTYGGGTVISNGTVVISNNAALGTGTATLAGGTLTAPAARTLANGINVTANSALTYAGTGDTALVLNGALSGAGGTTLTINHAPAGPDRLRVFDTNLTYNGDIVFSGAGIAFACYSASGTQTFNGVISGNGQLMRRSAVAAIAGTTIFNGNNIFTGGTTLTDGTLGFGINSTGEPVTSGPLGTGALVYADSTSATSVRTIYASGGARTVGNAVTIGGTQTNVIAGANDLTLSGTIGLGGATRTFEVNNTGKTIFANVVSNGGLTKNGNGTLLLNGTNTYTGPTTVNAGTLGGNGVLASAVTVGAGGNLAPGASIGILTISNNLTLGGTFTAEANSSASPNCDQVVGIGTLTYGGTLVVANVGPALTASDTFAIFSATTYGGTFASITPAIPGANLAWNTNTLTTDGTLRITSTGGGPSTTRTNLTSSVSGSTLTLSWPTDHIGWTLQTQTNSRSVGLTLPTNTWFDVTGSTTTNQMDMPVTKTDPTVFYRLKLFVP